MEYFPPPLEKLVEQFARLPGIGGKSAQRLAFFVLGLPEAEAQSFADAIVDCAPSAPPPSGKDLPSAWWRTPGTWPPSSAAGSITATTTSFTGSSPP